MNIGILGAGQLGCMLAQSLFQLGAKVLFYDPTPKSPGFFRTPVHFQKTWDDKQALRTFFSQCDKVTYEFENVSTALLQDVQQETKTPLTPSVKVLQITQNRILEKSFLRDQGFPVCDFDVAYSTEELLDKIEDWVFPYVIKTANGGYDGKGQWKIGSKKDKADFLSHLSLHHFPLIKEEFLSLQAEASCIVARKADGQCVSFPIFQNHHERHILSHTVVPAQIPQEIQDRMRVLGMEAARKLDVVGLLTTEFFLDQKENILVNELAPRAHNSGHVTRNACQVSQFDMQARILLDMPLHSPVLHEKAHYAMGNLLGDLWFDKQHNRRTVDFGQVWKSFPNVVDVVLYGKEAPKPGRKMGHFVVKANGFEEAQKSVTAFLGAL